jgi:hypothetical protein
LGTPEQRLGWLATHEAGHAVVAWWCPVVGRVDQMIIEPAPKGDEAVWQGRVVHDWSTEMSDQRCAWDVVIALAGLAAETIRYGQVKSLLLRDLDEALSAARTFCRRGAIWPTPHVAAPVAFPFEMGCSEEQTAVLRYAWATACAILLAHRDAHARLARQVAAARLLDEQQLASILGDRPTFAQLSRGGM